MSISGTPAAGQASPGASQTPRTLAPDSKPRLSQPDVAVFFDFENIYVSVQKLRGEKPYFRLLMDACAEHGRVIMARAYADWTRPGTLYTPNALYANGIEPIYVPTGYRDEAGGAEGDVRRSIKTSVDLVLCIDVMKVLFQQPNVGTFILLSSDRDFIPLVNTLRQHGKRVVLIAVEGAVSSHLIQAVDAFIAYERLVKYIAPAPVRDETDSERPVSADLASALDSPVPDAGQFSDLYQTLIDESSSGSPQMPATSPPMTLNEALDLLRQALRRGLVLGYTTPTLATLKPAIRRINPTFDESLIRDEHGVAFMTFKDFIREAQRRGLVDLLNIGDADRVRLLEDEPGNITPELPSHLAISPPSTGLEVVSQHLRGNERFDDSQPLRKEPQ